jgi:hypothetical protein
MRHDPARTRRLRVLAGLLTLLSGAVMMTAGYALAEWGWTWAALLATAGGVLILGAFALVQRGA